MKILLSLLWLLQGSSNPPKDFLVWNWFLFYLVGKTLAAVAIYATSLNQPSKRLLGLELNVFYYTVRKKLAAIAINATGLNQPSKLLLGLGLIFF